MQFDSSVIDDILVLQPNIDDLDASNSDEFKKEIIPIISDTSKVILDLSKINFMDSAGLGAMLSVYKTVTSRGGQFRTYGLNKEVKALFELVRMYRLFQNHDNRESAMSSFIQ